MAPVGREEAIAALVEFDHGIVIVIVVIIVVVILAVQGTVAQQHLVLGVLDSNYAAPRRAKPGGHCQNRYNMRWQAR